MKAAAAREGETSSSAAQRQSRGVSFRAPGHGVQRQADLAIGPADDPREQDADSNAVAIAGMPSASLPRTAVDGFASATMQAGQSRRGSRANAMQGMDAREAPTITPSVRAMLQRKCAACEGDQKSFTKVSRSVLYTPPRLMRKACACGGSCRHCSDDAAATPQPKLTVNEPGDAFEQEADRVADQVMRISDADVALSPAPVQLSRKCAACEKENERRVQMMPAYDLSLAGPASPTAAGRPVSSTSRRLSRKCATCEQDDETARRKPSDATTTPGLAPPIVHDVLNQPGRKLDPATRAFFEPRFGIGLDEVRIHIDRQAQASAVAIDAQAYTVGTQIAFAAGRYAPNTRDGKRLLAHELSHVLQQGGGTVRRQQDTTAGAGCDRAPTNVGDIDPDPPCAVAEYSGSTELRRWLFCLDSDRMAETTDLATELRKVLDTQPDGTRFLIHGLASAEGRADYNFRLACHRANRVSEALAAAMRQKLLEDPALANRPDAESRIQSALQSRIEVGTRGATEEREGGLPANRAVVLYGQIPGGETPEEPACKDAPRNLGDIKPEKPCDEPTIDLTGRDGGPHLTHFHFCESSDVLNGVGADNVARFAHQQGAKATFIIHGFVNAEGKGGSAKQLACHRALRVARELMNAGVPSERITEISGVGELDKYGDADLDRVAIVSAEGGDVEHIVERSQPASNRQEKLAIVEAARGRILAGQYRLGADAFISFWTCGRTPTLSQAVERLTIEIPDNDTIETDRRGANGVEQGRGLLTVRLSNAALTADDAISCTMGRIIDMAFHQAELVDPDLSGDAATRHAAGLHMIALAGLDACTGKNASARLAPGKKKAGIDEPLADDPRAGGAPPCAQTPEPSRLLAPVKDAKNRQHPEFVPSETTISFNSGGLKTMGEDLKKTDPRSVQPLTDMVHASTKVAVVGNQNAAADYEVGFMQTILDDLALAEYVSGQRVVQRLPTPIRAAQLTGGVPVPQPWMALGAAGVPTPQGGLALRAAWRLQSPFAPFLNFFRPDQFGGATNFMDTWQRHTTISIWLVARRRTAPLDRASVLPLDGRVYEVSQNLDLSYRREMEPALKTVKTTPLGDVEQPVFSGQFRALQSSANPADLANARFDQPIASDVGLLEQFVSVAEAPPAPQAGDLLSGMSADEYRETIRRILDEMKVSKMTETGMGMEATPRLGFLFAGLDVEISLDRNSGRIPPFWGESNPVRVACADLGVKAKEDLALALALRLAKRDFLGQAKGAILSRQALDKLPGDKSTAVYTTSIPPIGNPAEPAERTVKDEPDLSKDSRALHDWAEMWACSEQSVTSVDFIEPKEFAITYWMDRTGKTLDDVKREPGDGNFYTSSYSDDETIKTFVPSPIQLHPEGFAVAMAHTHPMDDPDQNLLRGGDETIAKSGHWGRQFYIISSNRVVVYYPDGSHNDLGDRKTFLPRGVICSRSIPEEK